MKLLSTPFKILHLSTRLLALVALPFSAFLPAEGAFAEEAPTEIVVTAPADIQALREQVVLAQRNIYEIYSELNDNNNYDIECHKVKRTGTAISTIECLPNFVGDLKLLYGGADIMNRGSDADAIPAEVMQKQQDILQERMATLIKEDNDLFVAVATHQILNARLKALETGE